MKVGKPLSVMTTRVLVIGQPNMTSLLTLIIIGLPTSARSVSHNRERLFLPFMYTGIQTSGDIPSITMPVVPRDGPRYIYAQMCISDVFSLLHF